MGFEIYDVVIVGGGLAGVSSLWQLVSCVPPGTRILLLEAGTIGEGQVKAGVKATGDAVILPGEENEFYPFCSGTKVLPFPATIKMICTLYQGSTRKFMNFHGEQGTKDYLWMSTRGRDAQIKLAQQLLPDHAIRQLGTLVVTEEDGARKMREEYRLLKDLLPEDEELELWDEEKVSQLNGKAAGFTCGLFFPKDGIIDSTLFSKTVLKEAQKIARQRRVAVEVLEGVTVSAIDDKTLEHNFAKIHLEDGRTLEGTQCVIATGGFFFDEVLRAIVTPAYSYLAGLKPQNKSLYLPDNSPNIFTHGGNDWAMCDGMMRISGEDGYCALRAPRWKERCEALKQFVSETYPDQFPEVNRIQSTYGYGVYSLTPDNLPLVGKPYADSAKCYILGCNACGQSILFYAASLIPALLGYAPPPDPTTARLTSFLSPRRFRSQRTHAKL